ncbi:alpha/beta hydrolase [Candidatus Anaplasma sp. TIGMIC]|nr:alpha/beta hydrolase [Candidatus Anaplasma sp. TIGMIC]
MGGFTSEMRGPKASHLFGYCDAQNIDCVVFDYLGHGSSGGDFNQCVLSDWYKSCCHLIENVTSKPLILVGTSMGGWLMLRVAMAYANRVKGLVGMAAAPDFTETLDFTDSEILEVTVKGHAGSFVRRMGGLIGLPPGLSNAAADGLSREDSETILSARTVTLEKHGRSYTISPRLKNDGKNHLVLETDEIPIDCDIVLIHSIIDTVIPYESSISIAEKVRSRNVDVHLIKSSDHLLNDPEPLSIAYCAIQDLLHKCRDA